jgi:parvulin-like peptidyl-prolyl isomerase
VVDVVHALFPAGPDADRSARAFASSLVSPASEESFRSAAKVAGASAVERINGVGNRGRTLAGLVLVREFSDAAVRLTTASPRSDVVHTSYGSHIVLLLSRYEPEPFAASERVRALREEALNRRVRARIAAVREKYPSELQIEALQTLEIPASSP